MISVTEAKQIILQHCSERGTFRVDLAKASGKILAENIYSKIDLPPFPQSSVDGYAFNFSSWNSEQKLSIAGEVAAGDKSNQNVLPGETLRIFTGAPVPHGADAIVMQEHTAVEGNYLTITDNGITPGKYIRSRAAEIHSGDQALEAGTLLNPAAIGFLASIGVAEISVYQPPVVSLIITGKELQKPGKLLLDGQIYESNSFALRAACQSMGIYDIICFEATDDLALLTDILKSALDQSDIVLLTGGVSVGDYDFVVQAAENCAVNKLFHKVKQKPGKPLYFGIKDNKYVFGLPGNPASVLTCFYQYVILVLQYCKQQLRGLEEIQLPLKSSIDKDPGLTHFLKGYFARDGVTPLSGQESFRMQSFANANCIIEIPESVTSLKKGDLVRLYLLPGF